MILEEIATGEFLGKQLAQGSTVVSGWAKIQIQEVWLSSFEKWRETNKSFLFDPTADILKSKYEKEYHGELIKFRCRSSTLILLLNALVILL